MKELADDKINVTEKLKFLLGRIENIVENKRKCWQPAFSPFSYSGFKGFITRVVKSQDCVVKSKYVCKIYQPILTGLLGKVRPWSVYYLQRDLPKPYPDPRSSGILDQMDFIDQYLRLDSVMIFHRDTFNPLPDDKILDWSKLKQFADDNFKFDENSRKFSERVENTVGKGEIAPFPTVF